MPASGLAETTVRRQVYYASLMSHASGQGNDDALARMYASRMVGHSAFPVSWGMSRAAFAKLMNYHFPGYQCVPAQEPQDDAGGEPNEEVADLEKLMSSHRAGVSPSESWMASIVATACMGSDHLWQDLGLWCRDDLSSLMQRNFPALAEKNVHNMKWKKFLYKQLCIAEGVYVCRSPSCEICADYRDCFGPED
jgi:nitrogen fixation protein NifQ